MSSCRSRVSRDKKLSRPQFRIDWCGHRTPSLKLGSRFHTRHRRSSGFRVRVGYGRPAGNCPGPEMKTTGPRAFFQQDLQQDPARSEWVHKPHFVHSLSVKVRRGIHQAFIPAREFSRCEFPWCSATSRLARASATESYCRYVAVSFRYVHFLTDVPTPTRPSFSHHRSQSRRPHAPWGDAPAKVQ